MVLSLVLLVRGLLSIVAVIQFQDRRVITDFGADNRQRKVVSLLKDDSGINELPAQYKRLTSKLSEEIDQNQEFKEEIPKESQVNILIVEADGSLVPIVTTTDANEIKELTDRRLSRSVAWKEARLCLAHPQGSGTPVFFGTIGTPQQIGSHLLHTAIEAGLNLYYKVHAIGDGAPWIAELLSEVFGTQANYAIDFLSRSEYLADALSVGDSETPQTPVLYPKKTHEKLSRTRGYQ